MTKPSILVSRKIFPEVIDHLRQHFDVDTNDADGVLPPAELIARLQGKVGALTTGSERIDGAVAAACPQLRVVANIAGRARHQHARRVDRDHRRLRLCAGHGHGPAPDRE